MQRQKSQAMGKHPEIQRKFWHTITWNHSSSFRQSFELIYDCADQLAYDTLGVTIDVPHGEIWNGTICRAFLKMDLQWLTERVVIVVHNVLEVHAHGGHRRINSESGISWWMYAKKSKKESEINVKARHAVTRQNDRTIAYLFFQVTSMLRIDTEIQLLNANKQFVASRGLGQIDNVLNFTRLQPCQTHTFDCVFEFRTVCIQSIQPSPHVVLLADLREATLDGMNRSESRGIYSQDNGANSRLMPPKIQRQVTLQ